MHDDHSEVAAVNAVKRIADAFRRSYWNHATRLDPPLRLHDEGLARDSAEHAVKSLLDQDLIQIGRKAWRTGPIFHAGDVVVEAASSRPAIVVGVGSGSDDVVVAHYDQLSRTIQHDTVPQHNLVKMPPMQAEVVSEDAVTFGSFADDDAVLVASRALNGTTWRLSLLDPNGDAK